MVDPAKGVKSLFENDWTFGEREHKLFNFASAYNSSSLWTLDAKKKLLEEHDAFLKSECEHVWEYNDETMSGCGATWERKCTECGMVEK
jgi:hypothetical protein